jgi:hypothetical protein
MEQKSHDARRRAKTALRTVDQLIGWAETAPPSKDYSTESVLNGILDSLHDALTATDEVVMEGVRGLKQQLAEARKALDERAGHIQRMDIVDLGSAAAAGLISQAAYEAERSRRAKNLSRPAVHRTSSTPYNGGAAISGHMPCAEPSCWTIVDLSKNGSGYCSENVHLEPRTYITGNFQPLNLDDLLYDAEREHERATRELQAAEKQLTAAREAIERFDAQHRA